MVNAYIGLHAAARPAAWMSDHAGKAASSWTRRRTPAPRISTPTATNIAATGPIRP